MREMERTGGPVDLLRLSSTGKPEHYVPAAATRLGSDLWTDLPSRGSGELAALLGVTALDHPKPVALIRRLLQIATAPDGGDLVLDFFAGSGTTAHAVLEQNQEDGGNRRFLLVERADPLPRPVTLPDATTLTTVADVARERIRRVSLGWRGELGPAPGRTPATDDPWVLEMRLVSDPGAPKARAGE
jgi:adenine-specific DNA-methyltransferase